MFVDLPSECNAVLSSGEKSSFISILPQFVSALKSERGGTTICLAGGQEFYTSLPIERVKVMLAKGLSDNISKMTGDAMKDMSKSMGDLIQGIEGQTPGDEWKRGYEKDEEDEEDEL